MQQTLPPQFCNKLRAYTKAVKPNQLGKMTDEQIAGMFTQFNITDKRQDVYHLPQ